MSHSSRDKAFVRRLSNDLKSHSIDTWLDEENIPFGASIPDEIQKGLDRSDILFVFLSEHSVTSRWVTNEWQSKFFEQISNERIIVVPVLIEKCKIPTFLVDKRYVDFQRAEEYESNFSKVLNFLSKTRLENSDIKSIDFNENGTIFDYTKEIMIDLSKEYISLPIYKKLSLIGTLKKIPRSGKKLRLIGFNEKIKVRSVYDHVMSVAHLADCLMPHINHGINRSEFGDIAICIAYHELNEVILGDIPSFTSLNRYKRNVIRVHGEQRIRSIEPLEREKIANKFIWMFLSEKHRTAFDAAMNIMADKQNKVNILFKSFDKIDPIVSVWRYLHFYRNDPGFSAKDFNNQLQDFYNNPDVKAYLRANKLDQRLIDMVINLQDRDRAAQYYESPEKIFGEKSFFEMPVEVVRRAIEGAPLFYENY